MIYARLAISGITGEPKRGKTFYTKRDRAAETDERAREADAAADWAASVGLPRQSPTTGTHLS